MSSFQLKATCQCLKISEMVFEIASHLDNASDLYSASLSNRLWYSTLVPLRVRQILVHLKHIPSLLSFFQSDKAASYHCQTLRITSDNENGSPEAHELDLTELFSLLANIRQLKYFTYALHGESQVMLPETAWKGLRNLSDTLQGLHVDVHPDHWPVFLSSTYPNLRYIRLFLDADTESPPGDYDAKRNLLNFLGQIKQLEVLHLCLGPEFDDLDFSHLYFPHLRSFMLISKALGTELQHFIQKHKTLESLDVFSDSEVDAFQEEDLPNLKSLQVCAVTIRWYEWLLKRVPTKKIPAICNLQVTAADEAGFAYIQRFLAPLGPHLRCLELIFWYRNAEPLSSVVQDIAAMFPFLAELSIYLPAPESDEDDNTSGLDLDDLKNIFACFTSSKHLRALALDDTLSVKLLEYEIEELDHLVPSNLRYVVWRGKSFLLERSEASGMIRAIRTVHPRYQRENNFLNDWHEEMVYNHTLGIYE